MLKFIILNKCSREQRNIGDWSNGMIGVSKTFGGSSILSSPAINHKRYLNACDFFCVTIK